MTLIMESTRISKSVLENVQMPMTTRYSLAVAFQKDNGIPDIHASEPGAVLPSSKKKKTTRSGREDDNIIPFE